MTGVKSFKTAESGISVGKLSLPAGYSGLSRNKVCLIMAKDVEISRALKKLSRC